jgi:hypothetical protein
MSILPDGPWNIIEGEFGGRPIHVRVNTGAKAVAMSATLAHRVSIAVALLSPNDVGLPTSSESAVLVTIEDALCESLLAGTEVILAVVITTYRMREFVFYSAVPAHVSSAITSVREQFPSYELQLFEANDPEWVLYDQFVGA